jgi:hypothetical protein
LQFANIKVTTRLFDEEKEGSLFGMALASSEIYTIHTVKILNTFNFSLDSSDTSLAKHQAILIVAPFCLTIFASAYLLFQVQPVIGKFILPWFGSTPGVWATCLLFFQLLLIVGYGYAHMTAKWLKPIQQAGLHVTLLIIAALMLPIAPDPMWKPVNADAPVLGILSVLAMSVGAPYLILSSTGPLIQSWYAQKLPEYSPYRLYALSNIGSLLGLLSYPLYFERTLTLDDQSLWWSLGYILFILPSIACAWLVSRTANTQPTSVAPVKQDAESISTTAISLWVLLSACGSALLLATTTQMTMNIAIDPFLWVLPLAIYLVTFILCFDSDRWYVREIYWALLPIALVNVVRVLYLGLELNFADQIFGYSFVLFVACMCLHGELSRMRPETNHLTLFYLMVSIGGAIGGIFVAIVAPFAFDALYEYPLLLVTCFMIVGAIALNQTLRGHAQNLTGKGSEWRTASGVVGLLAVAVGCIATFTPSTWDIASRSSDTRELFSQWHQYSLAALAVTLAALTMGADLMRRYRQQPVALWLAQSFAPFAVLVLVTTASLVLAQSLAWVTIEDERRQILKDRNFYGTLSIREYDLGTPKHHLGLRHGNILHGEQLTSNPNWPTSYFAPATGIGIATRIQKQLLAEQRSFKAGVIGLGVGTLAVYSNAKIQPEQFPENYAQPHQPTYADIFRFYELNPMVNDWAETRFSYLQDARDRGADISVAEGDARIVLEHELTTDNAQQFDLLAVDAFSGDAIPVHLITKEAIELYWQHLNSDGVLALHISNRVVDLSPVVTRIAEALGYKVLLIKNKANDLRHTNRATWMLMTNNPAFLRQVVSLNKHTYLPDAGPLWTDDFSSVYEVLE